MRSEDDDACAHDLARRGREALLRRGGARSARARRGRAQGVGRAARARRPRAPTSTSPPAWCAFRPSSCCAPSSAARGASSWPARRRSTTWSSTRASRRTSAPRAAPPSSSTTRPAQRGPPRWPTCRRRRSLLDEVPEVDVMWTTITANDVPVEVRELVVCYIVLTESRKHVTLVDSPSQAEPLLRIDGASSPATREAFRERPRFSTLLTAASPLRIDGPLLDFHAEPRPRAARRSRSTRCPWPGRRRRSPSPGRSSRASPSSSASPPPCRRWRRARALVMGVSGATMDMRSAGVSYASPECRADERRLRRGGAPPRRAGDRCPASPPTPSTPASRPATRRRSRGSPRPASAPTCSAAASA